MTVLAFDTATSSCAICIWQEGKILANAQKILERGHAEVLVPMIEGVLREAALTYGELELLAVTIGPGAFTGIRIGLATARSLALASGLPLIGVGNFDALAQATTPEERQGRRMMIVLETKRSDFYACCYDDTLAPVADPKAVDEAALVEMAGNEKILLVGDVIERASAALQGKGLDIQLSSTGPHVDPAVVAALAAAKFRSGGPIDLPRPLYLKPPDVNLPADISAVTPPIRPSNNR
jgi:tRNA threonylcarbamoyladenosine biosynthesis protein TsaB